MLLPIVIPSNVILAPVLALFIAIVLWQAQAGQPWTQCSQSPAGFAGGHRRIQLLFHPLGCIFGGESRAERWSSARMVAGNLTLALLAHAGLFAVTLVGAVVFCAGKRHDRPSPRPPRLRPHSHLLAATATVPVDAAVNSPAAAAPVPPGVAVGALTLGCVAVTAAILRRPPRPAPYPRVFWFSCLP